jgi:DNA-binding FadR family transcriptional regulator
MVPFVIRTGEQALTVPQEGQLMAGNAQRQATLDALPGELPALESLPVIPKEQLHEKVSKAIVDQILTGLLAPGQRLPSERELARALDVSRPSLREALGALQTLGVVETRHGSGSWISADALDALAHHPDGALDLGVSPVMLLEARFVIEPSIASLAAERFVPDGELERLLEMMHEARDWENPTDRATWSDGDRWYHQRLATHTHNAVLVAAADYIASVQAQALWRRLRDDTFTVPGRIARAIDEHERIFQAVSHRRPDAAAAAARDHLQAVRDSMGLD